MSLSQCSEFLRTLCDELKLPNPPSVKFGMKVLPFVLNRSIEIEFRAIEPMGIALRAAITPCPSQKREELFIQLMLANFLTQGTGGAAIGLDRNEKNLSLSLKLPYELTYTSFKEHLEIFANYLEYWRSTLSK